jgi:hypothetical protein
MSEFVSVSRSEAERIKSLRDQNGRMPFGQRYYRAGEMTWEEFECKALFAYADPIYGYPWQEQFVSRAGLHLRTLTRWKDQNRIPGPATAMINAHWMMRQHGLELDE